jgi:hypothetical protein
VDGGPRYNVSLGSFDHNAGTRLKPAVAYRDLCTGIHEDLLRH